MGIYSVFVKDFIQRTKNRLRLKNNIYLLDENIEYMLQQNELTGVTFTSVKHIWCINSNNFLLHFKSKCSIYNVDSPDLASESYEMDMFAWNDRFFSYVHRHLLSPGTNKQTT